MVQQFLWNCLCMCPPEVQAAIILARRTAPTRLFAERCFRDRCHPLEAFAGIAGCPVKLRFTGPAPTPLTGPSPAKVSQCYRDQSGPPGGEKCRVGLFGVDVWRGSVGATVHAHDLRPVATDHVAGTLIALNLA